MYQCNILNRDNQAAFRGRFRCGGCGCGVLQSRCRGEGSGRRNRSLRRGRRCGLSRSRARSKDCSASLPESLPLTGDSPLVMFFMDRAAGAQVHFSACFGRMVKVAARFFGTMARRVMTPGDCDGTSVNSKGVVLPLYVQVTSATTSSGFNPVGSSAQTGRGSWL
jgi:hypothetical protein